MSGNNQSIDKLAAKVAVKVPHPDSLVEVRVMPPESNFEIKVTPGSEVIELRIQPGASLIELRITAPDQVEITDKETIEAKAESAPDSPSILPQADVKKKEHVEIDSFDELSIIKEQNDDEFLMEDRPGPEPSYPFNEEGNLAIEQQADLEEIQQQSEVLVEPSWEKVCVEEDNTAHSNVDGEGYVAADHISHDDITAPEKTVDLQDKSLQTAQAEEGAALLEVPAAVTHYTCSSSLEDGLLLGSTSDGDAGYPSCAHPSDSAVESAATVDGVLLTEDFPGNNISSAEVCDASKGLDADNSINDEEKTRLEEQIKCNLMPENWESGLAGENVLAAESSLAEEEALAGENVLAAESGLAEEEALAGENVLAAESGLAEEEALPGENVLAAESGLAGENMLAAESGLAEEEALAGENVLAAESGLNDDVEPLSEGNIYPSAEESAVILDEDFQSGEIGEAAKAALARLSEAVSNETSFLNVSAQTMIPQDIILDENPKIDVTTIIPEASLIAQKARQDAAEKALERMVSQENETQESELESKEQDLPPTPAPPSPIKKEPRRSLHVTPREAVTAVLVEILTDSDPHLVDVDDEPLPEEEQMDLSYIYDNDNDDDALDIDTIDVADLSFDLEKSEVHNVSAPPVIKAKPLQKAAGSGKMLS